MKTASRTRPRLVIPVETKVRELSAKFYMACVAAERGFQVILGPARTLRDRICWLPPGALFLDKSVAPSRDLWFENYRNLGLRIVAWCEEGLTFCDDDEYLRRKVAPAALAKVEEFFAWGPYQANLIRRHAPAAADRVIKTGNPRIDMLAPGVRDLFADDVAALRREYPRLLLINTNFSLCNHKQGPGGFLADLRANGKVKTEDDVRFAEGWVAHKQVLFDAFRDMLPELSRRFPDNTIVLRPHPSEAFDTWTALIQGLPNVRLVHQGNIVPWLQAAQVVIHNGCTTGLEGVLLGRPVLAYRPVASDVFDIDLPNAVSREVRDLPALLEAVASVVEQGSAWDPATPAARAVLDRYLTHADGSAADRIADRLAALAARPPTRGTTARGLQTLRRAYWQLRLAPRLRRNPDPHVRQKFPSFDLQEAQDLLRQYAQVTGRFQTVTVRLWKPQIVELSGSTSLEDSRCAR